MKKLLLLLCLLWLGTGEEVLASVTISEVAWMGDSTSANHEWIELFNNGDSVDVSGWTLTDGMNLNIALSGQIRAGEYAVAERTSDESAPSTALVIYTGALVNTGATLVLKDGQGAVQDQVPGGQDWEGIGGDNVTKETAQYTSRGWVTDIATPGAANRGGRVEEPATKDEDSTTTTLTPTATPTTAASVSSSRGSSAAVPIAIQDSKLVLKIDVQSVAFVDQLVDFRSRVGGLTAADSKMVRYQWNFGDSYYATSTRATHRYRYPGQYIVTLQAKRGQEEQVIRAEIKVLPLNFSLTTSPEGDIQLNNDAPYDVDISGYKLSATKSVVLPPVTLLKSMSTLTIARGRLGSGAVILLSDEGVLIPWPEVKVESSAKVALQSETSSLSPVAPAAAPAPLSLSNPESAPLTGVGIATVALAAAPEADLVKTEIIDIPADASAPSEEGSTFFRTLILLFAFLLLAWWLFYITPRPTPVVSNELPFK